MTEERHPPPELIRRADPSPDGAAAGERKSGRLRRLALAGLALLAIALLWHVTPIAQLADPEALADRLVAMRNEWWIWPLLFAGFLAGAVVLVPVTVLIALCGMVLGPWNGCLVAMAGTLASGWLGLRFGAWTGGAGFGSMSGGPLPLVTRMLRSHGVFAVAALRMMPVAPYTVVNIAMGAAGVSSAAFLAGTFIGLLPVIVVLTMLGDRLREAWRAPEPGNIALFVLAVALWLGVAWGLQRLVTRAARRG